MERLNEMVASANEIIQPVFVLCVGVDHFKLTNERLGRHACDDLLRMVSRRLRECVQDTDIVERTGGDEFIVVMGAPAYRKFVEVSEGKILDAFTRPFLIEGESVVVGISIGAVEFPKDGITSDALIRHAGRALRAAKAAGGQQMSWYGGASEYS